jgi:hypothetical protein
MGREGEELGKLLGIRGTTDRFYHVKRADMALSIRPLSSEIDVMITMTHSIDNRLAG